MEQGRSGRPVLVLVAQLPKWYFCLSSAPVVRFWCCEHRFRKDWKAQQNPKSQFSIYAHIVFINFFFAPLVPHHEEWCKGAKISAPFSYLFFSNLSISQHGRSLLGYEKCNYELRRRNGYRLDPVHQHLFPVGQPTLVVFCSG